jgi:tetratricopeptide (TPR) repeat protein
MLAPQSPFEAYRADLDRFSRRSEFGSGDTVWLLLAHCLGRLARVGTGVREQLAQQAADALRDLLEGAGTGEAESGSEAHFADLRLIVAGLAVIDTPDGANAVARGCRGFAYRMSEAGALSVAYSVLGHARATAVQASDRERGLLAADQARVARQLGELESADELYRVAEMVSERSGDQELAARASLGRGVLARIQGNYPQARQLLVRGLGMAQAGASAELQFYAHQGLTIVECVAKRYDLSLQHGWAAFMLSRGDATREAESLANLAQVCLEAGYPRAALQAFLGTLSRVTVLRVRLAALGGAALAAGRCGDLRVLGRLADEIKATVERSALPYENADTLRHLALAYTATGDELNAERYRRAALEIADARGYHELRLSCDRPEVARTGAAPRSLPLEVESFELVSSLSALEPETSDSAFVLTRSG